MSVKREPGRDVVLVSRSHLAARVMTFAAGALFVAALAAAGGPNVWGVLVMLVAVAVAAWQPHTVLPLLAMVYLVAQWIAFVPTASSLTFSPWPLIAAIGLLTFHTGAAGCAAVPAQAPLPPAWWKVNGRRIAIASAATTALWLLGGVVSGATLGGGIAPALVAIAALAVVLIVHYRRVAPKV